MIEADHGEFVACIIHATVEFLLAFSPSGILGAPHWLERVVVSKQAKVEKAEAKRIFPRVARANNSYARILDDLLMNYNLALRNALD